MGYPTMKTLTKRTLRGILCLGLLALSASAHAQAKAEARPEASPKLQVPVATNSAPIPGANAIPAVTTGISRLTNGIPQGNRQWERQYQQQCRRQWNAEMPSGRTSRRSRIAPISFRVRRLQIRMRCRIRRVIPNKPARPGDPAPPANVQTLSISNFQTAPGTLPCKQQNAALPFRCISVCLRSPATGDSRP